MGNEEEWVKMLTIPGIALPSLRDLRIQFAAIIVFDLMMGPIVYINELRKGSSYIKKLKSWETLSEVYAGLARSPQHTISTLEEDIAIFKYTPNDQVDIQTLFLISCLPESDLEPIRELGQKALFKAKGDPDKLGRELSTTLREKLSVEKKVLQGDKKSYLFYWDEERIIKQLDYKFIKGMAILDYESKYADLRNLPMWIEGKELDPKAFISFVDNQIESIDVNSSTSLLYKNIPFLSTKVKDRDIYIFINISGNDLSLLQKISKWLNPYGQILGSEWKLCSSKEIRNSLSLFDEIDNRNTPKEYLKTYATMLLRSERIKPSFSKDIIADIETPDDIDTNIWNGLIELEGNSSIDRLWKDWKINPIDTITILEWARVRNLLIFLQN